VSVHSRRGVVVSVDEGRGCGVHSGREGGGGAEASRDAAACAASTGAAAELSEIPQPQRRVDREDFVIICSAIVPDEGRNQKPSEVIRGHQRPSEVIRGHQRPSEAIRGHQRPSAAIRGDHSVEVSRGQSSSVTGRVILPAAADQPPAIGAETRDRSSVPLKHMLRAPGAQIPYSDRMVT
jgi:hypothetical protein